MQEFGIGKLKNKRFGIFFNSIISRFTSLLITIFFTYFIVVFLVFIAPGKNAYRLITPKLSSEAVDKLLEKENISFWKLSKNYLINLANGDLGISSKYNDEVSNLIFSHLIVTLFLSLTSFVIQFILCASLAGIAINHSGSIFDRITDKVSTILYSIPTIIIAPLIIFFFGVFLKIFPLSGYPDYIQSKNLLEIIIIYIYHFTLPVLTLVISLVPMYYKYFREVFYDISNKEYVLYLKSLGMKQKQIYLKSILPNSMNTVLSIVGVDLGILLSGTLITEIIFGIPGIGRLFYDAIYSKDYSLIIASAMYSSIIFLLVNFIIDIIRMIFDKRLLLSIR